MKIDLNDWAEIAGNIASVIAAFAASATLAIQLNAMRGRPAARGWLFVDTKDGQTLARLNLKGEGEDLLRLTRLKILAPRGWRIALAEEIEDGSGGYRHGPAGPYAKALRLDVPIPRDGGAPVSVLFYASDLGTARSTSRRLISNMSATLRISASISSMRQRKTVTQTMVIVPMMA